MKSVSFILLLSAFVLSSCGEKKKIDPRFDDSLYELVDKGFYRGKKDQKTYIKTMGVDNVSDTSSKVQYFYKEVPAIDIPSFSRLMHAGYYARDKNQVYIWETSPAGETIQVLEGANASSFKVIGYKWGKDTNAVYYGPKKINGLNPALTIAICFEEMDSSMIYIDFIRDDDQLFYQDKEIKVPPGVDIQKIYCKLDLVGNSFLAVDENLYMVKDNTMILYE